MEPCCSSGRRPPHPRDLERHRRRKRYCCRRCDPCESLWRWRRRWWRRCGVRPSCCRAWGWVDSRSTSRWRGSELKRTGAFSGAAPCLELLGPESLWLSRWSPKQRRVRWRSFAKRSGFGLRLARLVWSPSPWASAAGSPFSIFSWKRSKILIWSVNYNLKYKDEIFLIIKS